VARPVAFQKFDRRPPELPGDLASNPRVQQIRAKIRTPLDGGKPVPKMKAFSVRNAIFEATGSRSTVSLVALLDVGEAAMILAYAAKLDAPVREPEPKGPRKWAVKGSDVGAAATSEACEGVKDAEGGFAVDVAEVGAGLRRPVETVAHERPNSRAITSCGMPSPRSMAASASMSRCCCSGV